MTQTRPNPVDYARAWIRLWSADLHIGARVFRAPWFTAHPDGTYTGERILCERRVDGSLWCGVEDGVRAEVLGMALAQPGGSHA